jgi:ADP-ribosylation factor-like protein 6
MGFFKRLFGMLSSTQKCQILIVGLDDAGKTTIMNQVMPKARQYSEVVPTVGFKVERFKMNNIEFTMFDMSGPFRAAQLGSFGSANCPHRGGGFHSLQGPR